MSIRPQAINWTNENWEPVKYNVLSIGCNEWNVNEVSSSARNKSEKVINPAKYVRSPVIEISY